MVIAKIIIISLLSVAVAIALPVDKDNEKDFKSSDVPSSVTSANDDEDSESFVDTDSSGQEVSPDDDKSDQEKPTTTYSTDFMTTTTEAPPDDLEEQCFKRINVTIRMDPRPPKVVQTTTCCDGYADQGEKKCQLTACAGLTCNEDKDSKCVVIRRECTPEPLLLPVFFNKDGFVSTECEQPAKSNLCLENNVDFCRANSTCPGRSNVVCMGSGQRCDCAEQNTWFHGPGFNSGQVAQCNS